MALLKDDTISFKELEARFHRKQFNPLYLLYGEEDFLAEESIDLLITSGLDEATKSFNLDVVYGSDVSGKDIVALASAFPMMGERRLVVVREFDKARLKDAEKEPLIPYIENPNSSTCLVLVSRRRPDFRLKLFKLLKEQAVVGEFKHLYENELVDWIGKRLAKMGKKATGDACQLIQTYLGRSLREIRNELEKLVTYVGSKGTIESDDVMSVVGLSRQFNIFELQKAIGQRNIVIAIEILENMLRSGESPIGMIVMITRYFQKLLWIQELVAAKTPEAKMAQLLALKPFFLRDYITAARLHPPDNIRRSFSALCEADAALKTSAIDEQSAMIILLYKLIQADAADSGTMHIGKTLQLAKM